MPVGRIPRVARVVHDCNGDDLLFYGSGQSTPAPWCPPRLIPGLSFAGQINSASAWRTCICHFGGRSICIGENAPFFCGGFEPACNTDAKESFFIVVEDHMIER